MQRLLDRLTLRIDACPISAPEKLLMLAVLEALTKGDVDRADQLTEALPLRALRSLKDIVSEFSDDLKDEVRASIQQN